MTFLTSPDGINWTRITTAAPPLPASYPCAGTNCPGTYGAGGLTFGHGVFLSAMNLDNAGPHADQFYKWYMKSTDGITWQWADPQERIGSRRGSKALFFVNDNFVLPSSTQFEVSPDGINWSVYQLPDQSPSGPGGIVAMAGDGTNIVGVGGIDSIERGTTFSGLSYYNSPAPFTINSIAANEPNVVLLPLAYSFDGGRNFTKTASPPGAGALNKVIYAANTFLAVGNDGTIIRSSAGDNWTTQVSNTTNHLSDVVYGSNLWVAVGANGTIVSSTDASVFTPVTSETTNALTAIAFGNGRYVAVGDAVVLNSDDGVAWTTRPWVQPAYQIAFGNGKFLAMGFPDVNLISSDGIVWRSFSLGNADSSRRIAFGGGFFVTTDGYISKDGSLWKRTPLFSAFTAVSSSASALFGGDSLGMLWKLATGPTLRGTINANRQFILNIDVPSSGRFSDSEGAQYSRTLGEGRSPEHCRSCRMDRAGHCWRGRLLSRRAGVRAISHRPAQHGNPNRCRLGKD